jgi:rod shape determining protein RodA
MQIGPITITLKTNTEVKMRAIESEFDDTSIRVKRKLRALWWQRWHLDPILTLAILLLAATGLIVLFSASASNYHLVSAQAIRLAIGIILMCTLARIPPGRYLKSAAIVYAICLGLTLIVLIIGHIGMGAQRWLSLGPIRLQPSELMRIATPLMLAAWFAHHGPTFKSIFVGLCLIAVPSACILVEPDLGTSVLVATSGLFIIALCGIRLRMLVAGLFTALLCSPILWHFMHAYQKSRVLTFLNPERDPLGKGYHIIQSEIAVGSGGLLGKGFLHGTQSHLQFLPTHTTDFIFSVLAEEWGFIGCLVLLMIYTIIIIRCLQITLSAQVRFERLLAGSLSCAFVFSALINIAMVIGLVPVVGVPLPLVSYGGSSMLAFMAAFGIIMSINSYKKLLPS